LPKFKVEAEVVATEAVPVPVKVTDWGLPGTLSVILIEAVRLPEAVGVNVTLIVQVPFATTVPPHVLVWAKSPALAPVTAMLVMLRLAFPVLLRVTPRDALVVSRDWLPKGKVRAERLMAGPMPVPDRLTDCWLPATLLLLSVMFKEAVRLPVAVGVNVTLIVQLPLAASELPHVVVSPKSPGLAPANAMLLMDRATFPVLFSVKVWAPLVVPRFWLLKVRLVVVTPAMGALHVPVRFTVCGLPPALSVMLTEAVRLPRATGVNVTLIVQLPFTATEVPHVLVTPKLPASVPVAPMLVMAKLVFPVLVRVTDCAALVVPGFGLVKVRIPVERLTAGPVPVPIRATVCGLLARLSAMLTEAVRAPGAIGENSTTIVQLAFGANELPQPFISEKSPTLAPVRLMLAIVKLKLPVFVRVTLCAVLVVPTF
jgi:hypothetical protein